MDLAAARELATEEGLALGVVIAVLLAGFRHGFDIDHIAAISDITSSQSNRRRSLLLATSYAVGHMLVLFALGSAAVFAGMRLPETIDSLMGRLIGLTLVALGVYVFVSLIRFRRDFRVTSRWMMAVAGVRRVLLWLRPSRRVVIEHAHDHDHSGPHDHGHDLDLAVRSTGHLGLGAAATKTATHAHTHQHVVSAPSDPFTEYGLRTSFFVGTVHGVGAETPTQVLLFTTAAGVAGTWAGVALVAAFVIGLLLGNTVLAVATTIGFTSRKKAPLAYMGLAALTAATSIYIGAAYLLDRPDILPTLLGGP